MLGILVGSLGLTLGVLVLALDVTLKVLCGTLDGVVVVDCLVDNDTTNNCGDSEKNLREASEQLSARSCAATTPKLCNKLPQLSGSPLKFKWQGGLAAAKGESNSRGGGMVKNR